MKYRHIGIIITLSLFTFHNAFAQTWRKRMLEQIAALQVHLGYVKKGYGILKDGAEFIGKVKQGEFSLHRNYFDSLLVVNPAIAASSRIKDILRYYDVMVVRRHLLLKVAATEPFLSAAEISSLRYLLDDLAKRSEAELGSLELATSNGKLKLTDDERLSAIEQCYERMRAMNAYQRTVKNNLLVMVRLRGQGLKDTRMLHQLYDLDVK